MDRFALASPHLSLCWNPFSQPEPEDISRLAAVDVESFAPRLRRPRFAVQYLSALHAHFPGVPYLRFPENTKPPAIPHAPILFLDETRRLPSRLRRRIFATGSRPDHSAVLARAGVGTVSIRSRAWRRNTRGRSRRAASLRRRAWALDR
jgi:hypothetical protein